MPRLASPGSMPTTITARAYRQIAQIVLPELLEMAWPANLEFSGVLELEKKYALSYIYDHICKETMGFKYLSRHGQYMSFYFAYIDEYGDAGSLLTDSTQPLFMLTAAFVPVEKWVSLETALCEILDEMRKIPGLENLERLHAVDLYQRKKPFRSGSREQQIQHLTIPQSFEWFEKILSVIHDHDIRFISEFVFKNDFHKYIQDFVKNEKASGVDSPALENIANSGDIQFPIYLFKLFSLMLSANTFLIKNNAFSTLVLDQHTSFNHYANSKVYSEIRRLGVTDRILENPVFADSRVRPLLAVPDFLSYVVGTIKMIDRGQPERPQFHEWLEKYVAPLMIPILSTDRQSFSFNVNDPIFKAFAKFSAELKPR